MINTENMIPCDDGLHLIQLDENISHYGWVFRKVEGGWPYSVRKATPHEVAHAKARQHLRAGAAQIAAQYQPADQLKGEPVAYQIRSKTDRPESQWTPWRECCETTRAMHSHEVGRFNQHGIMREIRPVFTHADPGEASKWRNEAHRFNLEVERLRAELLRMGAANAEYAKQHIGLIAQLAEAHALLRELAEAPPAAMEFKLQQKVKAALSATKGGD